MKVNVGAFLAFAVFGLDIDHRQLLDPRVKLLKELPPKPIGSAADDQRKPLRTGRRGKGTRKQRKAKLC